MPCRTASSVIRAVCGAAIILAGGHSAAWASCGPDGLGVAREIKIDASSGPIFGAITRYAGEPRFLAEKEVVLTFDDGPVPHRTRSILKTLKAFCTKATFFPVGRMAIAYPKAVREIIAAGHTVGGHTWSHPLNLRRLSDKGAIAQVEKGFSAIAMASGGAVAPFFRFPGLNDDAGVLKHLQSRGVATFSVDVVSDDSYTSHAGRLADQTMARIEQHNGGIVLFHDIKSVTTAALPIILKRLKARGYNVVHLTAARPLVALADYDVALKKRFDAATRRQPLPDMALRAPLHPVANFAIVRPPVTTLAPTAKKIELARVRRKRQKAAKSTSSPDGWSSVVTSQSDKPASRAPTPH